MNINESLCVQTIDQLAPQIKSGKLSPGVDSGLPDRIEALDPG
jgi:hypothetical protein